MEDIQILQFLTLMQSFAFLFTIWYNANPLGRSIDCSKFHWSTDDSKCIIGIKASMHALEIDFSVSMIKING